MFHCLTVHNATTPFGTYVSVEERVLLTWYGTCTKVTVYSPYLRLLKKYASTDI